MLKKEILIVINNFHVGGIQKSLINLLSQVKNDYDITVLAFSREGSLKESIPKEIKIIEGNKMLSLFGLSYKESCRLGLFGIVFGILFRLYARVINNHILIRVMTSQFKIDKFFDFAISFSHNNSPKGLSGGCNEFVLNSVRAKTKIAFVHCDYLKCGSRDRENDNNYRRFDKVACCSEGCKKTFIEALPDLKNKTYVVKNFHNYKEIDALSAVNPIIYDSAYLNILTVSRISKEKGIERVFPILMKLKNEGFLFRYHIVGDGPLLNELKETIKKYGLEESIFFYGNQNNPYRYFIGADLFLLPSFHEAAPMVIDEAKYLKLPIFTTKTTSANEMVLECGCGFVCENTTDDLTMELESVLRNPNLIKEKKGNLEKLEVNNDLARQQLMSLLDK